MHMENKLLSKVISIAILTMFVALVFFVLIPPTTAVLLDPGVPSPKETTTGNTVTFSNVNLTIRGYEKIPINHLNFTIYNNASGNPVAYVIFYINGTEISEFPSNKFTVTNTTAIGSGWSQHGYQNGTDEENNSEHNFGYGYGYGYGGEGDTDVTFRYDITYTTHTTGTFYAKLSVNSTSATHLYTYVSSESITFTIRAPSGGGGSPPYEPPITDDEEDDDQDDDQDDEGDDDQDDEEFLFDVELELTQDSVTVGEDVDVIIDLTNVGEEGLVNATINCTLYDEYGNVVWSTEENLSVYGHKSLNKVIPTTGLEPGIYTYKVVHSYGTNQIALAEGAFSVVKEEQPIEPLPLFGGISCCIVVVVLLILLIIITLLICWLLIGLKRFLKRKLSEPPIKEDTVDLTRDVEEVDEVEYNDDVKEEGGLKDKGGDRR